MVVMSMSMKSIFQGVIFLFVLIVAMGIQTQIEIYHLTILEWAIFILLIGSSGRFSRKKENFQFKREIARLRNRSDQCSLCNDWKALLNELAVSRIMIQDFLGNHFKCNICQDILLDGVETSCKHRYCGGCLKRWRWEMDNCPLCRVEFQEAEEPTLLNSVNKNVDDIFNAMPSTTKQERQDKRQEFLRMKRPAQEQPRNFTDLEEFLRFVTSNDGTVTRNGDGTVRVVLPRSYSNVTIGRTIMEPVD